MKKKVSVFLVLTALAVSLLPITVNADTGPKPSVQITFENMGDELCYGTLLSKSQSTGPASVWDGNEEHIYPNGLSRDIWQVFVDYKDADGFYFLQWGWQCNVTKTLKWGYYPPQTFKILLYYPDTQTFAVSEILERYAFDSYFTVNMDNMNIGSVGETPVLPTEPSYDYACEITSFVCRVVITILLEIGIALLFGFRFKKQLLLIIGINAVTQIILNVALNLTIHYQGYLWFIINYISWEFIVLAVEAVAYALFMKKVSDKPIKLWKPIVYALAANVVSFAAGLAIAYLVPEIFLL